MKKTSINKVLILVKKSCRLFAEIKCFVRVMKATRSIIQSA